MKMKKNKRCFLSLITAIFTISTLLAGVFYFNCFKSSAGENPDQPTTLTAQESIQKEETIVDQLLLHCSLIDVQPLSISFNPKEPQLVQLSFDNNEKAFRFKKCLQIAESVSSDISTTLSLCNDIMQEDSNQVIIKTHIPIRVDAHEATSYFQVALRHGEQDPIFLYCPSLKTADQNFHEKDYAMALENYQKVIAYLRENNLSDPSDLLNAICGSMFCYDLLCQEPFAKAAFDELVYEVALLEGKVETVNWFRESPVYPKYKNRLSRHPVRIKTIDLPEMSAEENCEFQCDGYAFAASWACSKVPVLAVQAVCYGCIFGLNQLCSRCCKGDGFWENCVKGLRRLFHDPNHPKNPAPHPYE